MKCLAMKCFFDKKKKCPVPIELMGGSMCLACTVHGIGDAAVSQMVKQANQVEATQVYKPKNDKDDRRMEIG
jgi:hypothetical protein